MERTEKSGVDPNDPIQDAMGHLGRWHIVIILALAIIDMPSAWHELAMPVLAPGPNFTCVYPTPIDTNVSMHEACYVKVDENLPEVKCEKFSYDISHFKSTIITEWDLVCDRMYLRTLVQPLSELFIFIGTIASGVLADKIGRKPPLMIALLVRAVAGTTAAFMSKFELFLLFKLIAALATGGTMQLGFSIVIEIVSVKYRTGVLILYQASYALGFLMVPGFSYLTGTWNGYWLMINVPTFLLLFYYWLIPESPRWYLAHGRVEEARQVLEKAAKWNKIAPETVNEAIDIHEKLMSQDVDSVDSETERRSYGFMDLMKSPKMRMRTMYITFNWFKDGLVFYGLDYYLGRMNENVLTNLAITAVFQFPALVLAYYMAPRICRLKIMTYSNIVAGLSLLLIIPFYNNDALKITAVTIGSTCLTIGFMTGKVYTGELFPTVVRNVGFAVCSVCSSIGTIISPFMVEYNEDIPYWVLPLVFGLVPLVAAVFCWCLPETMYCKLPDTIEEAENLKSTKCKEARQRSLN